MPDTRQHRGPHPQDRELLAESLWPNLQSAVEDFSWLLTREYAAPSALKIVGDRFRLNERQRLAVMRSSCSDQSLSIRRAKLQSSTAIGDQPLWLDGFNVLTTLEAALAGGAVIRGRDGCYRDMASMHGSYRKVAETESAIRLVGNFFSAHISAMNICWWLDRPVSNSGRLRAMLLNIGSAEKWNWTVELADNPDRILQDASNAVIATADGVVLDRCKNWLNVARTIVELSIPSAWIVPMSRSDDRAN